MPTKKVPDSKRRRCASACSTCKARKERCDGRRPCARCIYRRVERDCSFKNQNNGVLSEPEGSIHPSPEDRISISGTSTPLAAASVGCSDDPIGSFRCSNQASFMNDQVAFMPPQSRLLGDGRLGGRLTFIGDSANLAFLKVIRQVVSDRLGPCAFTEDKLRHMMVDNTPEKSSSPFQGFFAIRNPAHDGADAREWLGCFLGLTNPLLGLFDEPDLVRHLHSRAQGTRDNEGKEVESTKDVLFYLMFALELQCCADADRDDDPLAQGWYEAARTLAHERGIPDEASCEGIQFSLLSTMYLLNASRRNAAFMALGTAVRAAHVLGIHDRRRDNGSFGPSERRAREGLWAGLRLLDVFLSASLGRPLATSDPRSMSDDLGDAATAGDSQTGETTGETTAADEVYTDLMLDICSIFESILNEVYARRMVTTEALENISQRHRRWAARLRDNATLLGEVEQGGPDLGPSRSWDTDKMKQNMRVCHLKLMYYWSIMILSRPFLTESVARTRPSCTPHHQGRKDYVPASAAFISSPPPPSSSAGPQQLLVHACIDSAVRTIELVRDLLARRCLSALHPSTPKRLPFVVNSIFHSALVLGLAVMGDLGDHVHHHIGNDASPVPCFPLEKPLVQAHYLLKLLSPHDAVARRDLEIVGFLIEACEAYSEKRARLVMDRRAVLVGDMFGSVDARPDCHGGSSSSNGGGADGRYASASASALASSFGNHQQEPVAQGPSNTGYATAGRFSDQLIDPHIRGSDVAGGRPSSGGGATTTSSTLADDWGSSSSITTDDNMILTPPGTESLLGGVSPRTLLLFDESYDDVFPYFSTMDFGMS